MGAYGFFRLEQGAVPRWRKPLCWIGRFPSLAATGGYDTDKEIDKIRFMFQDYTMLPHQISLSAEKEMIRRMQRQAEIVEALGLMDEAQEEK